MQSNIDQAFGADLQLAKPHFDDEATLLSARPVVPLRRLKKQARSRVLAFGLAIVVALMVGALGATFIDKQRGQKQEPAAAKTATAVSEPTSPEDLSVAEAGGATVVAGEAKPLVGEDVATRKANIDPGKWPAGPVSQSVESTKRATGQNDTLNKKALKEARQAERLDAGLRRSARQQSRIETRREARRSQSPNGLLRVREIFEGPPKP